MAEITPRRKKTDRYIPIPCMFRCFTILSDVKIIFVSSSDSDCHLLNCKKRVYDQEHTQTNPWHREQVASEGSQNHKPCSDPKRFVRVGPIFFQL